MQVRIVSRDGASLEVEVIGENETLLNLLKMRLLQHPDVATATYIVGHPLLDQPRLYLQVKKGKPEAALRSAAKSLREDLDRLETEFLRVTRQAGT